MHFNDAGIVLSVRKLAEHGGIVRVLTANHGVYAGVDRFAFSSKRRGLYQPGNRVQVEWRARLSEQLGSFTSELVEPVAAYALDDRLKLSVLQSACQLTDHVLNEREPHADAYDQLASFCAVVKEGDGQDCLIPYVFLEFMLIANAGFGLDLSRCAATGGIDDLAYVSPKSGRAVSSGAGQIYKDKLLRLPPFLLPNTQKTAISTQDLLDALRLTGYFLESRVFTAKQGKLPTARLQVVKMLSQTEPRHEEMLTA